MEQERDEAVSAQGLSACEVKRLEGEVASLMDENEAKENEVKNAVEELEEVRGLCRH